ncbi:CPBP family intramembrane glutamic endopeptidase [Nocardioides cynanchi]|uniref:CPBP family intramembrane glutamic endopeptidase n=1 Tax=Nocardioides cynanchi TaxID=2558918 RepID=UPI00177B8C1F|nr:CPBP family intramembrane glutamic endopeptidase [Nocardioides cynanchi]
MTLLDAARLRLSGVEAVVAMVTSRWSDRALRTVLWSSWVVAALLLLEVVPGGWYGLVVAVTALLLCLLPRSLPAVRRTGSRTDLLVIAALYVGVVALMRLAFVGFTTDHVAGLFLSFAAALILGVVGPIYYTVWRRHAGLDDLGLKVGDWRVTGVLALVFAGVQFALTLWGYDLPAPVDWVPLLVMALVVGVFESVFFRGFIQTRLEAAYGPAAGIGGAAVLYGLYHVGYGMGGSELVFLAGLGIVYAVAFAQTRSVLVLWPLLTPLGSFFNSVDSGDIDLPWASIAGFVDVLAVMGVAIWLGGRHARRSRTTECPATPAVAAR